MQGFIMNKDQLIKNLTLLLMYLTSWEKEVLFLEEDKAKIIRTWKGYPFEVLDQLNEEKFVYGSKKAKSLYLTDERVKKAEELLHFYQKVKQYRKCFMTKNKKKLPKKLQKAQAKEGSNK